MWALAGGRPQCFPSALARAMLALTRSRIMARSPRPECALPSTTATAMLHSTGAVSRDDEIE